MHTHTSHSDGTTSPSEVIFACLKAGVKMMAVTDHDTVEAVEKSKHKAETARILYVPGVEISTKEHDYLHILGYGIDIKNRKFNSFLA
jgi:predicted metal-dependent phosphoesterase TrpH